MDEANTNKQDKNDIESARQHDIKKTKLMGRRDWVMDAIALIVVIGFFAITFVIALTKLDQTDHDVLYILIGQMAGGFVIVLSFFFGSTRKP